MRFQLIERVFYMALHEKLEQHAESKDEAIRVQQLSGQLKKNKNKEKSRFSLEFRSFTL